MRLVVSAIAICACLSGCTKDLDFTPTMASDPPFIGIEGMALQAEMLKVFKRVSAYHTHTDHLPQADRAVHTVQNVKDTVEGDTEPPSLMEDNVDDLLPELSNKLVASCQELGSKQLRKYKKYNSPYDWGCYVYKSIPDNSKAPVKYLESGMALTDYYCDIFFKRIAQRSAKRQFTRGTVNDVGTAISAVLGLASAGSGITGGIGAGFGLVDSGIQNYDEAFLVHADLPALQKLVRSEQDKIRNAIFDDDVANGVQPKSFQQAAIQIMRYANTCSFTGMRGLLTQSMIEKANASRNPLDGSRILDFNMLSSKQQEALIETLGAQKKLNDATREVLDAQPSLADQEQGESDESLVPSNDEEG